MPFSTAGALAVAAPLKEFLDVYEGISLLRQTLSANEAMAEREMMLPLCLIYLGEADILAGPPEGALAFVERAVTVFRECGQRGYEAHALRLLGDIDALRDRPEEADKHYGHMITLAGTLDFHPLVAHCHLGLGNVYPRTSKPDQARDHLTVATTLYLDMDMPFWLKQAEAEMRQLR